MATLTLTLAAVGLFAALAASEPSTVTIEELQKQVQALQEEVARLKDGPPRDAEAEELLNRDLFKAKGLSVGFYGEAKYRFPEAGHNVFDPHRFVLTPSYQLNDWLIFNSELEFEHGGIDEKTGTQRSKFDGEIELEQFYADILLHPGFNVRFLGIDLVPVGRINKYHEPTVFYSTERPELYREIIPSTWFEPSVGVFGKVVDGLAYQLMISTGLEDAMGGSTTPGITAASGMREARPRLRQADESDLAYSGRLHYYGLRGLDASTSFYVTRVRGHEGRPSTVALWDVEAAYRVPKTGLELRGDLAFWHLDRPRNLLVNNNASLIDDVGRLMYGWYVEASYHFWPEAWKGGKGRSMDLVPFVRYSQIATQVDLLPGSVRLDNGTANKEFITAGLAWFLNANFVIKADWRHNLRGSDATQRSGANQDYFQIGGGIFF
ncbi:MAG: hypothetical protein FJ387_01560 [Verrucomicrobia bacterium]|nr:hypothetical protein [Verrucomicrobiota bacterium]